MEYSELWGVTNKQNPDMEFKPYKLCDKSKRETLKNIRMELLHAILYVSA